jgi:hypothetical protein
MLLGVNEKSVRQAQVDGPVPVHRRQIGAYTLYGAPFPLTGHGLSKCKAYTKIEFDVEPGKRM